MGSGPNPQSPIPNPQSPLPKKIFNTNENKYKYSKNNIYYYTYNKIIIN